MFLACEIIVLIDYGEQCDGSADCGTDCKFLCGNGKLDSGEECYDGNK